MTRRNSEVLAAIAVFLLSLMACEPVIAIGWEELLVIFLILAFLLGPFILRFWRAFIKAMEDTKKEKH